MTDFISKLSNKEKVYFLILGLLTLIIIILEVLGLCNVLKINSINKIAMPLLGITMIFNGAFLLKQNKIISFVLFGCAAVILIAFLFTVVI